MYFAVDNWFASRWMFAFKGWRQVKPHLLSVYLK